MANNEKAALKHVVKADRRFQSIRFFALLLILAATGFILYGLQKKIDDIVTRAGTLVNQAIDEAKIRDFETAGYYACALQVPLDQRTPEVIRECLRVNDLPGGLDPDTFNPKLLNLNVQAQSNESPSQTTDSAGQVSQPLVFSSSPPKDTQPSPNVQPNPSQPEPADEPRPNIVVRVVESIMGFIGRLL